MQLGKAGLGLSVLALLLVGASPVFAGDPGGPGAPNNTTAFFPISGTSQDIKLIFFSSSTVGATASITSETCGTITGNLTGSYCDYRNTVINLATGDGTFSALDNCICDAKAGVKHASIVSTDIGTIVLQPNGVEKVQYTAIIQKSFGSTITIGSYTFIGQINPITLIGNGTYSGFAN